MILISTIVGSIVGLNQTSIRKILTYSNSEVKFPLYRRIFKAEFTVKVFGGGGAKQTKKFLETSGVFF